MGRILDIAHKNAVRSRICCMICWVRYKKIQKPLFRNHEEFQDNDTRALN